MKRTPTKPSSLPCKDILKRKPTAAEGRNTADSTIAPRVCRRRLAGYPVGISPAESIQERTAQPKGTQLRTENWELRTAFPVYNQNTVPKYSIVVPLHNEQENVTDLYDRLKAVMEAHGESFEIVLVDDGSKDHTFAMLREIAAVDSRVTVVKLRRNFGQTAGLAAGFDHARGEYIIAMDGDLQHDPNDIPLFLEKIAAGYDIVSGWRKVRVDNFWMRRIPSRIANWMMAKISGVDIHDFGTTFKAYRRDILEQVPLYGELHRFIPALASWHGATICEVPIRNVNRERGVSHYGITRTFRVFFDLLTIRFLLRYLSRPLHFFGSIGMMSIFGGSGIVLWLGVEKFLRHVPVMARTRPADDGRSRLPARRLEPARHRPARRNASPPLPRTQPPRPVLRRPRPPRPKRRAQRLGIGQTLRIRFSVSHFAAGWPLLQPHDEIRHRRHAAQFAQPRRILSAMIVTVHRRLRQRLTHADLQRRLNHGISITSSSRYGLAFCNRSSSSSNPCRPYFFRSPMEGKSSSFLNANGDVRGPVTHKNACCTR